MENNNNKNQRILSYTMSHKLNAEEFAEVSAAGMSQEATGQSCYDYRNHTTNWDAGIDYHADF